MLLILSLFIVLYELVRIVKMKDLLNISKTLKEIKDDKVATNNYFVSNPEAVVLSLTETLYLIVIIVLLFTPLFKLSLFLLLLSLLSLVVSKVLKKQLLAYSYIDSSICIISTIIAYHLFT